MMRRMGRPGLVGTMARTAVIAGTATAVSGGVRNRQEQRAAAGEPAPAAAPAAVPAGEVDIIGELKQLAEMRESGVLTDDEFTAAKAKLLG